MISPKLTNVEELILRGATYGLQLGEIAQGLGLSRQEVGRQIAGVYFKIQAIDRQSSIHKLSSNATVANNTSHASSASLTMMES